ncbi:hypothetical protein [Pseudarthrobacter sp. NPDC058119]|uniref:hypothetical protein n=1 Tax=Pseudarthrobacter sp. NPDC058119 TaxID=3346348 RepID=UPI0036DE249A
MESNEAVLVLASRRRVLTGDSRALSRGYRNGTLVRVRTGVYFGKSAWLALKPWERYGTTMAAMAAVDPSTTFCYLTALRIWRLPAPGVPTHVHVITLSPHKAGKQPSSTTAARDAKTRKTGIEHISGYGISRHFWRADSVHSRGFSVTSLPQTVMDCIVRLELPDAVALADAVLSPDRRPGEGLTRRQLIDASADLPSEAKRRRIECVLALADETSESVGESRSRAIIHVLGLPAPVLQRVFHDHDGFIARTDFFWPDAGVIGEFDGDAKYLDESLLSGRTTQEAILAEKKREDRLRALGYKVVRWDWKTLATPDLLRQRLAAAGVVPQKTPPRGRDPRA